jgi:hypothetical protein
VQVAVVYPDYLGSAGESDGELLGSVDLDEGLDPVLW